MGSLLTVAAGRSVSADLGEYTRRPEPDYSWSKTSETSLSGVKIINLKMRSQVWRGIPWDHQVQVFLPTAVRHPKTAMLLVIGGNPDPATTILGTTVAPRLEAPLVVLYNIPNQPLFEGKKEDDLIAHTFQEYLKDGDETWPLLFPMVKSAIKVMDAVQDLSRKEWPVGVEDFVVTGASKRGWTTYLTGASDSRVRGIAPMVFDNLKFSAQMPRQLELWGKYSEQIDDYTRRGLQQKMETPAGKKLISMVDPWFYREKLRMPKLLIHGANDPYWATDATRAYWDDLKGDKYLLAIPNAGHGLNDRDRLINTLSGFFHAVAAGKELPQLTGASRLDEGMVELKLTSSRVPKEVRLWTSRAADMDFRPLKWEATPHAGGGSDFRWRVDAPKTGGLSLYAEAVFEESGRTYTLTTPPQVFGKRAAAK